MKTKINDLIAQWRRYARNAKSYNTDYDMGYNEGIRDAFTTAADDLTYLLDREENGTDRTSTTLDE